MKVARADRIAGQLYYDVNFEGGAAANLILTDCTINGSDTERTETVITSGSSYDVQAGDYVITVNKTVAGAITIALPLTPGTSRSIIVKDGKGDAATNNITIDGNGKTIDGAATYVLATDYQALEIIYNGTEWNAIGEYYELASTGDVVGPASATDNAVVRFDGTTGKLIQNGSVTISDAGVIAGLSISGLTDDISNVALDSDVIGNLPVARLNSGTNASGSACWRG